MIITIGNDIKLHPIKIYEPYVEDLINDINACSYDFTEEVGELLRMRVELCPYPEDSYGDIAHNYYIVQGCISRITYITIQILYMRSTWKNYLSRANMLYTKAKNYYFTNDKEIVSLRNKELQEAAVQENIPLLYELKNFCDNQLGGLKDLLDIVNEKKEELDKINTNINRQQKVVEGLGGIGYPIKAGIRLNKSQ